MDKRIRIKGTKILFLTFFLTFLVYAVYHLYLLHGPRQAHYHQAASISLEQEKLGGIKLFQSIKTISPPSTPTNDNHLFDYYTCGNGITVAIERGDEKIIRIITSNSDKSMKTAKGIGIGNEKEEVISAYGPSFYTREEFGLPIIGYIDKTNHRTLEFWLSGNNITMIRYDIDSMD
ncbi:hypothetical protein DFP93_10114 [Aneurinibacillus soli]|uniref:Uncharacterized protein n=1 Tax=Aneurinibacillus soli TaxID=1500254 RepID=A0A0U5C710_9BACL|nr:hypothetical protein [Aneurinibacillus soli]PYE63990.1 hypothetical protein DFP93_10114 [Aneurinibacillus soli]BAU27939.1 hypothetical protein CB4_02113 [Aneurinibacillus soli]